MQLITLAPASTVADVLHSGQHTGHNCMQVATVVCVLWKHNTGLLATLKTRLHATAVAGSDGIVHIGALVLIVKTKLTKT